MNFLFTSFPKIRRENCQTLLEKHWKELEMLNLTLDMIQFLLIVYEPFGKIG